MAIKAKVPNLNNSSVGFTGIIHICRDFTQIISNGHRVGVLKEWNVSEELTVKVPDVFLGVKLHFEFNCACSSLKGRLQKNGRGPVFNGQPRATETPGKRAASTFHTFFCESRK